MATRATIKVEGFKLAKVYKHWDGFPKATLPWLEDFNKRFTEERGNDAEYKFAQLLRSSAFEALEYDLDKSTTTGWGVIAHNANYYEEYEYTLMLDGTVVVRDV